ncbi:MAG TPA: RNA polymerase sigma factor [Tepidisphaeraceae bacterium]|jgi:RNA polymerase sigma-70 factor (ECF subfamily)|nr:RNA polymerase sigma factor [Tepidisphaeraceae bacterium]
MVDWDAMVSREGPAVWRTVYRLLGNHADAEDCFQETFLAAIAIWRRETVRHPHALLQRLATARALDRLRRRYRRSRREGGDVEWDAVRADEPQPPQLAQSAELSDRLRAALAEIPPKQAQAFCLFYLDGWDYAQIAEELEGNVNAVGVLLHRARHRLAELLSAYFQAEGSKAVKP